MKKTLAFLFVLAILTACHAPKKTHSTAKPRPKPKIQTEKSTSKTGGVIFQNSDLLSPVLEKAQREKRPVFLEFTASWCAPCKVMEEDVFTQKPVFEYLNTNFLNFRTDFDSENGKTLAAIYEVSALPTVLFLNPQGVVLERKTGGCGYSDLRRMGDSALLKMK